MMMHEKDGDAAIQSQKNATTQEMWCFMKLLLGGHLKRKLTNSKELEEVPEEILEDEEEAQTPSKNK